MTPESVFSGFDDETATAAALPSDAELGSVSDLAERLRRAEADVIAKTEALKASLDVLYGLRDDELPRAMERAGTRGFELNDGTKVALRTKYDARKLTERDGLDWVDKNGGSALIKTVITVEFDRGDVEEARELYRKVRAMTNKARLEFSESVHNQTLSGWVRQLIEEKHLHLAPDTLKSLGVHQRRFVTVGKPPRNVDLKGLTRS